MKRLSNSYSIWGIFKNKNISSLKKIQRKLTKKFNSPDILLHLTLSSGFKINKSSINKKLKLIKKDSNNFFIETNNFGYKNSFFEALYLNVKINKNLLSQKKILQKYLPSSKRKYFPHISLFYGKLSLKKKREILLKLNKFNKRLEISELYLVHNDEKNLKWTILKKIKI